MGVAHLPLAHWPSNERRTLVGAALALLGAFVFLASWGSAVLHIQRGFGAGPDGEMLLRQLPDIAALLLVPSIGAFGPRMSTFRLTVFAAVGMGVGSVLMVLAPSLAVLVAGMCVVSAGRATIGVLAVAAVGSVVQGDTRRAKAFALLGAVPPIAFITVPLLAGWLVDLGGWRLVGVIWLASAALVIAAAGLLRSTDKPSDTAPRKEPWTPIVAGITLVGLVQWVSACSTDGAFTRLAGAWLAVTVVAAAVWFALARALTDPSLDGRMLRAPGLMPVLLVIMVSQCGELWFYVGALVHFAYRYSALQTALWLLPAQLCSLLGPWVAGRLVPRLGISKSGTLLMAVFTVSMFASCTVTLDTPVWVPVVMLSLASVGEYGSGVALTQTVMQCAPEGGSRQISSYRSAFSSIGNALTLLLVAFSVRGTMGDSMRAKAEAEGLPREKVEALVKAVRANRPSAEVGHTIGLDDEGVADLREVRRGIILEGFRAHGAVSGAVLALATVGFWWVRRDASASKAPA